MIDAQVGDLSSHTTKYTSSALTQKVFANMIRVGKGFSRVDTPLFEGMLVPQQAHDDVADVVADDDADDVVVDDKIAQALEITKLEQRVRKLEKKSKLKVSGLKGLRKGEGEIAKLDADEDVALEKVATKVAKDAKVEPDEIKEVIEVVTTATLMTEVVTAAATTIIVAPITAAPSAAKRKKGVVIRDLEETTTPSIIVHYEPKEDLEMLWQIVQERFASSKPKKFLDDFLLNTLKAMFENPNVEAHIWKNQRGSYGLAKVKSWKLLESYRVHIITFFTTQMILLVKRRYPLTRFTLDQMPNNVRLKVKEESEVLLELLRFVRRQPQEGYMPDFGVDAIKDFKEYTLRDYYCWLKTYCCWYKLKLLDNAADSRLRLLEESAAADEKMKK
uniref:Uncharacterized protein n=1 Tax=Tanacetum cinerariifolium TaxID=118510 RepID=A0A699HN90_TANCI|nr:hypothetical protein [Tanacetum cinerariifolium]